MKKVVTLLAVAGLAMSHVDDFGDDFLASQVRHGRNLTHTAKPLIKPTSEVLIDPKPAKLSSKEKLELLKRLSKTERNTTQTHSKKPTNQKVNHHRPVELKNATHHGKTETQVTKKPETPQTVNADDDELFVDQASLFRRVALGFEDEELFDAVGVLKNTVHADDDELFVDQASLFRKVALGFEDEELFAQADDNELFVDEASLFRKVAFGFDDEELFDAVGVLKNTVHADDNELFVDEASLFRKVAFGFDDEFHAQPQHKPSHNSTKVKLDKHKPVPKPQPKEHHSLNEIYDLLKEIRQELKAQKNQTAIAQ